MLNLPMHLFGFSPHCCDYVESCHKFRALDIAARYDYTVEFTGLGAPPPGKDVGFCTQIGVFMRKYLEDREPEKCKEHVYKTVSRSCAFYTRGYVIRFV